MLFAAASLGIAGGDLNSPWGASSVQWLIGAGAAAAAAAMLRGKTDREHDAKLDRILRLLST
jgi:hypothetical protein